MHLHHYNNHYMMKKFLHILAEVHIQYHAYGSVKTQLHSLAHTYEPVFFEQRVINYLSVSYNSSIPLQLDCIRKKSHLQHKPRLNCQRLLFPAENHDQSLRTYSLFMTS